LFYSIKGNLSHIDKDFIVIENNGMGYKVLTSLNTISEFTQNDVCSVFTQLIVREDDIYIVGFSTKLELNIFNHLRSVNGIGVKLTLGILSNMSISQLVANVIDTNVKELTKLPGIGQKTAQRIIIELKDLFMKNYSLENSKDEVSINNRVEIPGMKDLELALKSLGFSSGEIEKGLSTIDLNNMNLESAITLFLRSRG
jgi:Holliday junction DNA helicase RuvA